VTTEQQSEQVVTPSVDSDADLTAGFDEVRGGKSAPIEKPAAKVESATPASDPPATEAKKDEKPAPDEWEGVSAKVKSEIESMREKLGGFDKIAEQLRTINGHIGGLTSQQKQIRDALAQAKTLTEKRGGETPTQAQVDAAAESPAKWRQMKEDLPDWAEAVEERLAELAKTTTAAPSVDASKLKEEFLGEVDSRLSNLGKDATAQARVFAVLDLKHDPDWNTSWQADVNSPEYDAWFATQKPEVQALAASSAVKDASRLITLFREHRAQGAKAAAAKVEREDRLKRAVQPQGTKVYEMTEDPNEALLAGFNEVRGT
jgi:hypothetical protein